MATLGSRPDEPFPVPPVWFPVDDDRDGSTALGCLAVILATAQRSADLLRRRLADLHTLDLSGARQSVGAEAAVELASQVAVTMQLVDLTYRRLSQVYFEAVGQDDG